MMSIIKKGLRRILIGEIEYHWKIKRCKEPCLCCTDGTMNIMIEKLNSKKPLLIEIYNPWFNSFPQDLISKKPVLSLGTIKPKDIKNIICFCLKKGWNPDSNKLYRINFMDLNDFQFNIENAKLEIIK